MNSITRENELWMDTSLMDHWHAHGDMSGIEIPGNGFQHSHSRQFIPIDV